MQAYYHVNIIVLARSKDNYSILDILTMLFWVHDPLNTLPYSTVVHYSTVRGRVLMVVKFKFAMKNS